MRLRVEKRNGTIRGA